MSVPTLNGPHELGYHACDRLATSLEALRALICFRSIDLDPTPPTSFSGPHVSALRLRGPQARHSQHVPQLGLRPSQQLTELLMLFTTRVHARSRTARYHINACPVASMKPHCNKLLLWRPLQLSHGYMLFSERSS